MTSIATTINSHDNYSYSKCMGDFSPEQAAKEVNTILHMPGFKKNMNVIADLRFCRYDDNKITEQLKQYAEIIKPIVHQKGTYYKMAVVLATRQAMASFTPYIAFISSLKMPMELQLFFDFLEVSRWFHFDKNAFSRLQKIVES